VINYEVALSILEYGQHLHSICPSASSLVYDMGELFVALMVGMSHV
jgi:hypothetical protein